MKIEIDDDASPLIVPALEHYSSYLKATNRDDSRYLAIAETLKKPPASETLSEAKQKRK